MSTVVVGSIPASKSIPKSHSSKSFELFFHASNYHYMTQKNCGFDANEKMNLQRNLKAIFWQSKTQKLHYDTGLQQQRPNYHHKKTERLTYLALVSLSIFSLRNLPSTLSTGLKKKIVKSSNV